MIISIKAKKALKKIKHPFMMKILESKLGVKESPKPTKEYLPKRKSQLTSYLMLKG